MKSCDVSMTCVLLLLGVGAWKADQVALQPIDVIGC